MTVIGLTGGIASGKSTAAEYLRSLGATLIDADRVGHRSYEPGTPGFEKVVNAFGHDIVGKDGVIDRRILGGKVFGAPGEIERLNAIVWPEIRRLIAEELRDVRRKDRDGIIVLEAAVLIEAEWTDLCDEIWVVTTSQPIAIQRLMSRNGLTQEAALARINAQMSTADRAARADVKIDNSGTEEQLIERLDRAWKTLTKRVGVEPTPVAPRILARPAAKNASKLAAAKAAAAKAATAAKAPVAKAASKPAAKPAGKPAPKAAAKPASKPAAKAPARPAAKPASKPSVTATRAAAKPAARPASKPAAKPAGKVASKPAAKATKVAAKPAPRAAAKPASKPAAKAPARPAAKPAAKSTAAKAPARAASKPAAKTAAKPAARRR